jgi:hypothetical protein
MEDFDQYDEFGRGGGVARSSDPSERKSPSVSATAYSVGTQMEGNDGNMWEVVADKNGVQRWKKVGKGVAKASTKNVTFKVGDIFRFWQNKEECEIIAILPENKDYFERVEYTFKDRKQYDKSSIKLELFEKMISEGEIEILTKTKPPYLESDYFIFIGNEKLNQIIDISSDEVEYTFWDDLNNTFDKDKINRKMFDEMISKEEVIILNEVKELLNVGGYFYDNYGDLLKYEKYKAPYHIFTQYNEGEKLELKKYIGELNDYLVSYYFTSGYWEKLEPKDGDVFISRDKSSIWADLQINGFGNYPIYTLYFRDATKRTDKGDKETLLSILHTANAKPKDSVSIVGYGLYDTFVIKSDPTFSYFIDEVGDNIKYSAIPRPSAIERYIETKEQFERNIKNGEIVITTGLHYTLQDTQYFYNEKNELCKVYEIDSDYYKVSWFVEESKTEVESLYKYRYTTQLLGYLFQNGIWKNLLFAKGFNFETKVKFSSIEKSSIISITKYNTYDNTYSYKYTTPQNVVNEVDGLNYEHMATILWCSNAQLLKDGDNLTQPKPDIKVDKGDQFVDKRYPNLIGTITDIQNKVVKFDTFNVEDESSVIGVEMDENTFIDKLVLGDIKVLSAKLDLQIGDYFYNVTGTLCKVIGFSTEWMQVDFYGKDGFPNKDPYYTKVYNAKVRSYLLESEIWTLLDIDKGDIFTSRVDSLNFAYFEILDIDSNNKVIFNTFFKDTSVIESYESVEDVKQLLWESNASLLVDAQPKTPFIVPDDLQKSPNQKIAEFMKENAVDIGKLGSENPLLGKLVTDTLSFLNQMFIGDVTPAQAQQQVDDIKDIADTQAKIELKTIKITMAEGSGSVKGKIFLNWGEFNEALKEVYDDWAKGGSTGYNKVYIEATWDNDFAIMGSSAIYISDKDYNPYKPDKDPVTNEITFYYVFKLLWNPKWDSIDKYSFTDAVAVTPTTPQQAVDDDDQVTDLTIDIAEQIEELKENLEKATSQEEKDYLQGLIDDLNISLNFM